MPDPTDTLWTRALAGHPTIVRGTLPLRLDPPRELIVLRVRADRPGPPLGALGEAAERAAELLGVPAALYPPRVSPLRLRRRHFEPPSEAHGIARALELLHTLASAASRRVLLLFDEAGALPEEGFALIDALLDRRLLRASVAWVEGSRSGAAFRALCARWSEAFGAACVLSAPAPKPTPSKPVVAPAPTPARTALPEMPGDVKLTLRAASIVGAGFDAQTVAMLRNLDPARVMEHLQTACDLGVAIEDPGDGRFHLADGALEALRASILPSLARAWHARLAAHYSRPHEPSAPAVDPSVVTSPVASPRTPTGAWAEVFEPRAPEDLPVPPAEVAAQTPATTRRVVIPPPSEPDRAAEHLEAAGDPDGAVRALLEAAEASLEAGAHAHALASVERASALLKTLPDTPLHDALRAEARLTLGRVRWLGSGPGDAFTLPRAIEDLRAALGALAAWPDAGLRAKAAVSLAGALHDLGDLPSLEEALTVLSDASRALSAAGDAVGAARLLNDLAAVHVRLGDPVKAAWLLERSRAALEALQSDDPVARAELAETDHLFARLPLRVVPKPGMERSALELARDHATHAEAIFRALGRTREAARVGETIARIDLRAGRPKHAEDRLRRVIDAQRAAGDVVGLASATAALAEVLGQTGRWDDAARCLSDSIVYNTEKASTSGVALNRRALEALKSGGAPSAVCEALAREVEGAESMVGRIELPGS